MAEKRSSGGAAAYDKRSRRRFVPSGRTTFGRYLETWLAAPPVDYAGKTLERFASMARLHVIPALGHIALANISALDLRYAYAQWRTTLSAQTVLHQHRFIHRVLGQAVEDGLIPRNPATFTRANRPRAPRAETRFFSATEIVKLLQTAHGHRLRPLIVMALATGARRGELLALKWSDVNFSRGTIAIRRALEQTKRGVIEKTPKNGKSRMVPLPASAIEALRLRRGSHGNNDYIFPGPDGGVWIPHKVTDSFRELCRKAKVTGGSFHSLRHTAATQMLELEVPPKVVQERLGHSTIGITMDLYSHATPSLQLEATRRIEGVLSQLLSEADTLT
jgi:integrase